MHPASHPVIGVHLSAQIVFGRMAQKSWLMSLTHKYGLNDPRGCTAPLA